MLRRIKRAWFSRSEHPSDEALLRLMDGELSGREARKVRRHVDSCWACRTRRQELDRGIAAFMRDRPAKLQSEIEPPPKGWREFETRLAQLDESLEAPEAAKPWWAGYAPQLPRFAAAVAVLLLAVVWFPDFAGFRISAKELLRSVIDAEQRQVNTVSEPVIHRAMRVRCRPPLSSDGRPVVLDSWYAPEHRRKERRGDGEVWQRLDTLLRRNRMDLDNVLSVSSFGTWRASLPSSEDTVSSLRLQNGDKAWSLRTRAGVEPSAGDIYEAELVVRASDWQATNQIFRFREEERAVECEFSLLRYEVLSWSSLQDVVFVSAPPSVAARDVRGSNSSIVPSDARPSARDLLRAEVQTLYALHRIEGPYLDAFDVRRRNSGLEVYGVVSSKQQRRKVAAALDGIRWLTLRVKIPGDDTGAALPGGPEPATRVAFENKMPVEDILRTKLLGSLSADLVEAETAAFSTDVVSLSHRVWNEAWALRRLAERFPPEQARLLDNSSRWLVEVMVRDHANAAEQAVAQLSGQLAPLRAEDVRTHRSPAPPPYSTWDQAAVHLQERVSDVNDTLLRLFTASNTEADEVTEPQRLLKSVLDELPALKERTIQFRELLADEFSGRAGMLAQGSSERE